MMKYKVFNIFLVILLVANAQAQYTIRGEVKSRDVKAITPTINWQDSRLETSETGVFVINNVTPGRYNLTINHPDYSPQLEFVEVLNSDVTVSVTLMNRVKELETVIVQDLSKDFAFTRLRNVEGFSVFAGKKTEAILTE